MTETLPTTMAAWSQARYGSAGGTVRVEVPVPKPHRGEVLIRVRATALNAGDIRLMLGDPLLVRPAYGLTRPRNPVRGMDVAGTVVRLGSAALAVELAEEIVAELPGGGGLAEYACVPADLVVPRPADIEPAAAACLPIAGGTAWQALDLADVDPRAGRPQRVLVIGASGGVGTFAVQLAALRGAEVWATCAERNAALVERLGAMRVLDHRQTPLAGLAAGSFDAVLDIAGGIPLRQLQRLVAPGGAIVLVTGVGGPVLGPIPRMLKAVLLSGGSRCRIHSLAAANRPEVLRELLVLVGEGRLTPVIERQWPFEDAASALAHLEAGHTVGKVVVRGTSG